MCLVKTVFESISEKGEDITNKPLWRALILENEKNQKDKQEMQKRVKESAESIIEIKKDIEYIKDNAEKQTTKLETIENILLNKKSLIEQLKGNWVAFGIIIIIILGLFHFAGLDIHNWTSAVEAGSNYIK